VYFASDSANFAVGLGKKIKKNQTFYFFSRSQLCFHMFYGHDESIKSHFLTLEKLKKTKKKAKKMKITPLK
jgi:hypothetical protein